MKKNFLFSILLLIAAAFFVSSCGSASKLSKADKPWTYEVESAGVGNDGTYALRVWSYSRKPEIPLEVPKKNAIHAVIFKGVPAGNGATAQPPLIGNSSIQPDDVFFVDFFNADYSRFINSVARGSAKIIKTGKKEYKIGYAVSVAKDNLRKYLEEKGIVKSLSSGF